MLKVKLATLFFLVLVSLTGCPHLVVRDEAAVRTDYVMLQKVTKESGELLLALQTQGCQCVQGKWYAGSDCEKTAKMIIFLTVRFPWHMQMMLFNSGLIETRPPKDPPVMPPPESLCPTKVSLGVEMNRVALMKMLPAFIPGGQNG